MKRPRLTKNIIDGLSVLCGEIEVTMEARHGWDDYYPDDENEEKARLYLEALVAWWVRRQRQNDRPAHAKSRRRGRMA